MERHKLTKQLDRIECKILIERVYMATDVFPSIHGLLETQSFPAVAITAENCKIRICYMVEH